MQYDTHVYVFLARVDRTVGRLEKPSNEADVLLAWFITCTAWAQLPTGAGSAGSNRATPVPFSGRTNQAGAANAQQSTTGDGVTSSLQISGVYQGSVPGGDVPNGPITLTLADAVQRGLKI
jgi:hypothetical protein